LQTNSARPCTSLNEESRTLNQRWNQRNGKHDAFPLDGSLPQLLFQKLLHSISQLEAVVGHQVVVGVLLSVILQEGADFSPRSVAGSALSKYLERTLGPVFPREFEPSRGQLSDMVFSIASFDLNGPMGNRVSTQADIIRHDFHCTLLQELLMRYCLRISSFIRGDGAPSLNPGPSSPLPRLRCSCARSSQSETHGSVRGSALVPLSRLTRQPDTCLRCLDFHPELAA
jgi:hypothetical protein